MRGLLTKSQKKPFTFGTELSGNLLVCLALLGTLVILPFTCRERKGVLLFLFMSIVFAWVVRAV